MAMRVKNISEGYVDANGAFHPIRAASDYRAKRAGEAKKYATGKKRKVSKAKKTVTAAHVRQAAKKTVAQIKAMLKPKRRATTAKRNPFGSGTGTFRNLAVGSVFKFPGAGGSYLGQSTYRKTGSRTYQPADMAAAAKSYRYLYSGYPEIKITPTVLKKALTLSVGSINARVATNNPLPVGKYIKAKVKRMANGDVKVMISR